MKSRVKLLKQMNEMKFRHTKNIAISLAVLFLAACATTNTSTEREQASVAAEQSAIEQAKVVAEQEAARIEADLAREQEAAAERERQAMLAEQRRQEAEQEQLATLAEARARAEAEAQARVEQQRRQQVALQAEQRQRDALAKAEAERDQKLTRIAELEAQISAIEVGISTNEETNGVYQEAIIVAEELIGVLADEQAKYENVDENGNTIEPLTKELISDLENRRNALVRDAQARAR